MLQSGKGNIYVNQLQCNRNCCIQLLCYCPRINLRLNLLLVYPSTLATPVLISTFLMMKNQKPEEHPETGAAGGPSRKTPHASKVGDASTATSKALQTPPSP